MSSYLFNLIGGNPFQLPNSNDPYTWSNLASQNTSGSINNCLPSLLNDGSCLTLGGNILSLISSTGATTWSKNVTAINSNATAFVNSFWVDNVDSPNDIWGLALYNTTVYLFKIAISTGTLTNIGTGVSIANFSAAGFFSRAAMGSGNFTFYYYTSANGGGVVTINSSTGAIVGSAGSVVQNGQTWPSTFTNISYVTADGTVIVGFPFSTTSPGSSAVGSSGVYLPASRNGHISYIPLGNLIGPVATPPAGNGVAALVSVAGNVVICPYLTTFTSVAQGLSIRGFPVILRTTFDAWIKSALSAVQTQ